MITLTSMCLSFCVCVCVCSYMIYNGQCLSNKRKSPRNCRWIVCFHMWLREEAWITIKSVGLCIISGPQFWYGYASTSLPPYIYALKREPCVRTISSFSYRYSRRYTKIQKKKEATYRSADEEYPLQSPECRPNNENLDINAVLIESTFIPFAVASPIWPN